MKTKILLLLFAILFSCSIFGQETSNVHYKHSIGFGAGFTTGYGFSYRYIPKKMGFQLNFAPFYTEHGKYATVSVGLTLLRRIAATRVSNFYVYFANHYFSNKYKKDDYNSITNSYTNSYVSKTAWNSGIGVGFEFHAQKRIVLNLMAGLAQYDTFASLLPTGEMALYYRF